MRSDFLVYMKGNIISTSRVGITVVMCNYDLNPALSRWSERCAMILVGTHSALGVTGVFY